MAPGYSGLHAEDETRVSFRACNGERIIEWRPDTSAREISGSLAGELGCRAVESTDNSPDSASARTADTSGDQPWRRGVASEWPEDRSAASVDDATAAQSLFARLDGQPMSKVVRMYADSKYHNFKLYEWVDANADWELSIVRRPEGSEGWVRLPIRWTVERTFAWLGRCRRLIKDHEKSTLSSESYIKLAMIQLMTHRLRPSETEPEFHYRSVA